MLKVHAELSAKKAGDILGKSRQGTAKQKGRAAEEREALKQMSRRERNQSVARMRAFERGQGAGQ